MQNSRPLKNQTRLFACSSAIILLTLMGLNAVAAQSSDEGNAPGETNASPTNKSTLYTYRNHATDYLKSQKWHRPTSMCALGDSINDQQQVWFIWQDGKKIILWDEQDMPMAASRRIINIPRDVVPKQSDVKGSTYKVTKNWVKDLTVRCAKHGMTFQLPKEKNHKK
jgi:hypothetical protein